MAKPKRRKRPRKRQPRKPKFRAPSFSELLAESYKRARSLYPDLLGIHECLPELFQKPTREQLDLFGHNDWEQYFWDTDDVDYVLKRGESDSNFCGYAVLLTKGSECGYAVFLRKDKSTVSNRTLVSGILFTELAHELGHVDDMANRVNLYPGATKLDTVAIEVYAHWFALRWIQDEATNSEKWADSLPPSQRPEFASTLKLYFGSVMDFYLTEVLGESVKSEIASVRESGNQVLESPDLNEYTDFAKRYQSH